jgi:hypothetical protein
MFNVPLTNHFSSQHETSSIFGISDDDIAIRRVEQQLGPDLHSRVADAFTEIQPTLQSEDELSESHFVELRPERVGTFESIR